MQRSSPSANLAVVIPAYKATYLAKSLQCLTEQTFTDFNVYIGDDASPANLREIVRPFEDRLHLSYTRFPQNIGAKNLVNQWSRCIGLTKNERWLWLFSDDDLASKNCVEALFREQQKRPGDVYRFNTHVIDENDVETSPGHRGPDFESSEQMAYHLLHWQRGNSMPDHVFSRDVYLRKGGFVFTPFAQGADWATSILFSQESGMNVIQDALISWRRAGQNVSSLVSKNRSETIWGMYAFIRWVVRHFAYLKESGPRHGVSYEMIANAAMFNLREVTIQHYRGLPPSLYLAHLRLLRTEFGLGLLGAFRNLGSIIYNTRVKHR